jgi:hypothetical protein
MHRIRTLHAAIERLVALRCRRYAVHRIYVAPAGPAVQSFVAEIDAVAELIVAGEHLALRIVMLVFTLVEKTATAGSAEVRRLIAIGVKIARTAGLRAAAGLKHKDSDQHGHGRPAKKVRNDSGHKAPSHRIG